MSQTRLRLEYLTSTYSIPVLLLQPSFSKKSSRINGYQ